MSNKIRYSILAVAIILIGGTIFLLESQNSSHKATVSAGSDIAVPTGNTATSTYGAEPIATTTAATGVTTNGVVHSAQYAADKLIYPPAKELVSPDAYINTDGKPITIGSLIGKKVILVDFWTYSCINCQRTIPYLEAWYQKYQNSGLVIIGVHTPEFAFEKILSNVQAAVTKFGITYPVVLDSEYNTWDAYGNNYWPEEYLIDIDGLVREHNIGEGNYTETEQNIQKLLAQRATTLGLKVNVPNGLVNVSAQTVDASSPETYFDDQRNQYLGDGTPMQPGVQVFTAPSGNPPLNTLYLNGTWNIMDEYATNNTDGATITYTYDAKNVYFVAGANPGVTVSVLQDGKPVPSSIAGADLNSSSEATISGSRLYTLISQPTASEHTITITIHGTGLQAFTLDFG